jgi:hypothetical protein
MGQKRISSKVAFRLERLGLLSPMVEHNHTMLQKLLVLVDWLAEYRLLARDK